MGSTTTLTAEDGHEFAAYEAAADGPVKGRLVVVQEAFGLNDHIRDVCDRLADEGYSVVAPALYDREARGIELGYSEEEVQTARAIMARIPWDAAMLDVRATYDLLAQKGSVGITGFCWGGSVTWLAACRLNFACAVPYYGGRIIDFVAEEPACPTMCHFGDLDPTIPMDDVNEIIAHHPGVTVHVYPNAGHGFHCDRRAHYHEESARLAWTRTMAFFERHLSE